MPGAKCDVRVSRRHFPSSFSSSYFVVVSRRRVSSSCLVVVSRRRLSSSSSLVVIFRRRLSSSSLVVASRRLHSKRREHVEFSSLGPPSRLSHPSRTPLPCWSRGHYRGYAGPPCRSRRRRDQPLGFLGKHAVCFLYAATFDRLVTSLRSLPLGRATPSASATMGRPHATTACNRPVGASARPSASPPPVQMPAPMPARPPPLPRSRS